MNKLTVEHIRKLSYEEKINIIENSEDKMQRFLAITSINEDNIYLKYFDTFDENMKAGLIHNLSCEEAKLQCIEKLKDEKWIADTALTLSSKNKLRCLDRIQNLFYKNYLLESFNGTDIDIISGFQNTNDEENKSLLLTKLKDDEIKKTLIKEIKEDINSSRVVRTIDDDNLKMQFVEKLQDEKLKTLMIASMKDTKKSKRLLHITNQKCKKINLPKEMTIGIEIECEGDYSTEVLLIQNIMKQWKAKKDNSLENGVEIISPVLNNTKDNVKDIYANCKILSDLGQEANKRCGAHIHIGADYLKSKDSYKNLIELWSNNEEIIYMSCNAKGEELRDGAIEHASPISKKFEQEIKDNNIDYDNLSKEEFIEKIKEIQKYQDNNTQKEGKRTGLNLLNIGEEDKNTIEFRIANGTIDPDTWIENINLFGGMVVVAERLSKLELKNYSELSEQEKTEIDKFRSLNNENLNQEDRLKYFLDLVVPKDQKQIYVDRYNENMKAFLKNEQQYNELKKYISKRTIIFTESEIGKATINKDTESKDKAYERVLRQMHEREQPLQI